MKINAIITKYYDEFQKLLPSRNVPIYDGLTYEDMLNNVIITALNKWKNVEIEEEEGYQYIRKTLLTEILFSKRRKSKDKLLFTDNLNTYDIGITEM